MSNKIYTNTQPLNCCSFPKLGRAIGVSVHRWNGRYEMSVETVDLTVNTSSSGRGIGDPQKVQALVIEATGQVIAHLDVVIAEMSEHRARLAEELVRLELEGMPAVQGV